MCSTIPTEMLYELKVRDPHSKLPIVSTTEETKTPPTPDQPGAYTGPAPERTVDHGGVERELVSGVTPSHRILGWLVELVGHRRVCGANLERRQVHPKWSGLLFPCHPSEMCTCAEGPRFLRIRTTFFTL